MRINSKVYYIYKPQRPIQFHAGDGALTEEISNIELYGSREQAEDKLRCFDEPHYFDIGEACIYFSI